MEKLNLNQFAPMGQSYDSSALEQMKVDTYNRSPGDLAGYDCKRCLNKGSFAFLRDGRFCTQGCECMKPRWCINEMERSGLKNFIQKYTFDRFRAEEPWQLHLKQKTSAYASDPESWLMLCGAPGSGKTHLCTAVCRQWLLEGHEVRYMPWRERVAELKAVSLDDEKRGKILEGLKNAEILYIDDLFKVADGAKPTAADVNLAFELINHRYTSGLITIVSTEKMTNELLAIDEATGSRLIEMAGANLFSIKKGEGKNHRLRGTSAG